MSIGHALPTAQGTGLRLCGFTRLSCQLLISNAFAKFERIENKNLIDPVTYDCFARTTEQSRELYAWSQRRGADSLALHVYPNAFQVVQKYALAGQNERRTELEHFLTQLAGKKGTRFV